jgi:hypothetical protein
MTIGPDPMISTDSRSPRRGTALVYHTSPPRQRTLGDVRARLAMLVPLAACYRPVALTPDSGPDATIDAPGLRRCFTDSFANEVQGLPPTGMWGSAEGIGNATTWDAAVAPDGVRLSVTAELGGAGVMLPLDSAFSAGLNVVPDGSISVELPSLASASAEADLIVVTPAGTTIQVGVSMGSSATVGALETRISRAGTSSGQVFDSVSAPLYLQIAFVNDMLITASGSDGVTFRELGSAVAIPDGATSFDIALQVAAVADVTAVDESALFTDVVVECGP